MSVVSSDPLNNNQQPRPEHVSKLLNVYITLHQMQTLAFVNDKFYFEFVINSEEDLARITKRAFKGVKFNDQSTVTTVAAARKYYATLLAN